MFPKEAEVDLNFKRDALKLINLQKNPFINFQKAEFNLYVICILPVDVFFIFFIRLIFTSEASRALHSSQEVLWDIYDPSSPGVLSFACEISFRLCNWLFMTTTAGFISFGDHVCSTNDTPSAICSVLKKIQLSAMWHLFPAEIPAQLSVDLVIQNRAAPGLQFISLVPAGSQEVSSGGKDRWPIVTSPKTDHFASLLEENLDLDHIWTYPYWDISLQVLHRQNRQTKTSCRNEVLNCGQRRTMRW